jgi:serine protease Do
MESELNLNQNDNSVPSNYKKRTLRYKGVLHHTVGVKARKKIPKKMLAMGVACLCIFSAIGGGVATIGFSDLHGSTISSTSTLSPKFSSAMSPTVRLSTDQSSNYPTVQIAQEVGPAVVNITNYQSIDNTFDGFQFGSSGLQEVDSGSGFIIDAKNGYIVTNNHVIAGAQKIMVNLSDGRNVQAKVVGADPLTDLAVLQISAPNLIAVHLGDSTKLQVGEPVVAIGNPGGIQFARSETAGIISATNRMLDLQGEDSFNLIQTDAAINPGNSGGPLVNYQGEVIGINSAKFDEQGFEGMGFAIPISDALPTIEQLIKTGAAEHPALMVSINDQYDSYAQYNGLPQGAYIASVTPNGPADKAGLQAQDVITEIDDYTVHNSADLVHALYQYKVGDKVTVTFIRDGQTKKVQITLGEISSNQ